MKLLKRLKSQTGIALILVLSSITILTTMAVEFAYNANVNYHLARNEVDRLKAIYLAKSAYNFMRVELKFDRVFRQIVQSQNLGQFLGANASLPLCQQFPLSTGLIRAVFMGGEGNDVLPDELKGMVSMAAQTEAQEFLDFEGDFDAVCVDESVKINLNGFYGLDPAQKVAEGYNAYDKLKIDLAKFLARKQYAHLFEDAGIKTGDVVRNIADWIDSNEMINEIGGAEAGPEMMLYERQQTNYPIKNSKFSTLDEAFLVAGVVDEWFAPIKKFFTIYGDGAVNVCNAEEIVVHEVIRRYVEDNPDLPPIKLDDPETMEKLVTAVYDGCAMGGIGDQQKQQIASSLNAALGALGETEQSEQTAGTSGFANLISTEPRFFSLTLTGVVGDVSVVIDAVLDVKDANPKRWNLLYWRMY
ncbi:MAG: hypothetical protein ABH859_08085 [Pseudomonadota bacterium]